MPRRPNLAAISSLASRSFSGTVFRAVPLTMREKILSTEGNRYYSGHYHIAGETGILYTSLGEEVAFRELARHAARASVRTGLATGRIKVRLPKVLDLTDAGNLGKLGLSREGLISPNYAITQAISLQARRAGLQGILVPSAAGDGKNLIVFENNLGEGCSIEVQQIRARGEDEFPKEEL